jgi:hypothetical protein
MYATSLGEQIGCGRNGNRARLFDSPVMVTSRARHGQGSQRHSEIPIDREHAHAVVHYWCGECTWCDGQRRGGT